MFHTTSHRHLMLQHVSPRTTIFYIWDHIILQSASAPPFHTTTSRSTTSATSHSHSPHHTIPHPQLSHTTPTLNTTAYFTPHHIPPHYTSTSWFYITPPHLTTHCIIFHIWHHTAHATFFITTILHHRISTPPRFTSPRSFPHLALCNILHTRTTLSTPRHIPHHTFCISITPCLKLQHSTSHHWHFTYTDITPHFTSHHNSHQITPPHLGTPFHITPTFHLTPRHAHHWDIQI